MDNWTYTEELRSRLGRHAGGPPRRGRHPGRDHDRDVARMLSPWRGRRGGPDPVARYG